MLLFLIDGELLHNANDNSRQALARLAHYFTFHYDCNWKIYNDALLHLKGWHPLVLSPIPYPKIDVIDNLQKINQSSIIIFLSADNRIKHLKGHPLLHTFQMHSFSDNIFFTQIQIETTFHDLLQPFKIKRNPSNRFYDLFFPSHWEDIFDNRTTLPPIANAECERFGPFNWLRRLEYSWALAQIDYTFKKKTLDVGSLNTFVPRYLAEKGLDVVSIDIDLAAVEFQRGVASSLKQPFIADLQDVQRTNFPDNYFDQAIAISVIEHIPDEGDILAMKELHRIVKVDGIVTLTVPYDHHWTHEDTGLRPQNYRQRYYSMQSVIERLVQPPMFKIVDLEFIGGKRLSHGRYKDQFINPTNAAIVCLALSKQ